MFLDKKVQNLKMFWNKKAQNLKIRCTIILVHNFVGHRFVYFGFCIYLPAEEIFMEKTFIF